MLIRKNYTFVLFAIFFIINLFVVNNVSAKSNEFLPFDTIKTGNITKDTGY